MDGPGAAGLGGREGLDLLVYLHQNYFPSLKAQAAAATLGAWTDDPAGMEDAAIELLGGGWAEATTPPEVP